jgi:hypothetical protein
LCALLGIGLAKDFPATQNLTATTPAEIGVLQTRLQQVKTVSAEDAVSSHDNGQLSAAASLGNLPLIVLAAGQNVANDPVWPLRLRESASTEVLGQC